MSKEKAVRLFQDKKVRVHWDQDKEKWFFSIVDVIGILTESPNARKYWSVLKNRLKNEGNQLATDCSQLKLLSSDGKYYKTDVADTEQLLRLIQSIPSKNAEPFKLWLAKVGNERIDETEDPEIAINRALETYKRKGYSNEWINQRLKSIDIRKELTEEWQRSGIQKQTDFAILTNEITKAWSGKTVKEYKKLKDLKKENLKDNMSNMELVLNMLAEVSTKEISKSKNPKTFDESRIVAKEGGSIAGNARQEIEKETRKSIISSKNNLNQKKKIN
ncbi:MAG: BRO family protein [Candidatus Woesearchaeota archaeon]